MPAVKNPDKLNLYTHIQSLSLSLNFPVYYHSITLPSLPVSLSFPSPFPLSYPLFVLPSCTRSSYLPLPYASSLPSN